MNYKLILSPIIYGTIITGLASCNDYEAPQKAVASIQSKSGGTITGSVSFTEKNKIVTMVADLSNVAKPGKHAIHIHAVADCTAADGSSAGGHWNPVDTEHGKWGINSYHKGDIGNILVDNNGKGKLEKITDQWCIGCDDDNKNILGKSIIIHQAADDFTSQPSGAAGVRIGCGEIVLVK